jgi:ABC-type transport system involved in Fe-S cluster assembly fused permease/ATPase subunit
MRLHYCGMPFLLNASCEVLLRGSQTRALTPIVLFLMCRLTARPLMVEWRGSLGPFHLLRWHDGPCHKLTLTITARNRRGSNIVRPAKSPLPEDNARRRGDIDVLKSLWPFLWPKGDFEIKARVVFALLAIVVAKIANVFVPYFLKLAVDALDGSLAALPLWIILAYGAARLMSLAFGQVRDAIFAKVGVRAVRKSALAILEHLHRLSLKYHLQRETGGLSRSIERGTVAIQTLLSITLFNLFPTLFEVGLVTVILWGAFDVWFAFATFSTVAIYVVFTAYTTEWRLKFRREMNQLDNQANTRAIDSLLNYETVKAFGNEKLETAEYDSVMENYEQASVRTQVSLAYMNIGQSAIISVGVTALMVMAGFGVVNGTMTQGDFVMVNTYMLQLAQPLNFFGFVYRNIKQALVDLEKMFDILDEVPEVKDKENASPLKLNGGRITFENVTFSYDERRPILKGVSFDVPAGKSVAIVGPTGSGKSTIGRLLFRMYDVTSGSIKIDGQDISEVTQESLRAEIGIVPQDTVLFNNTLKYNLSYAKPGVEDTQLENAARMAHIETFISVLPDGYETRVGERGLKLSGGEKQRVAIARVIIKDCPILLFDEATSALDTHTEKEIQANLAEVSAGRTTVMIAHRLSTIVDADEILVLEEGEVVERGTHAILMASDGAYASAWKRQQKSFADATVDGGNAVASNIDDDAKDQEVGAV